MGALAHAWQHAQKFAVFCKVCQPLAAACFSAACCDEALSQARAVLAHAAHAALPISIASHAQGDGHARSCSGPRDQTFFCRLPAPMSNPGLTPEWASIILDSHQKNFADECAICFSEIGHDFRVAELAVKADDHDDVASAGTAESDDFAREAIIVGQPGGLQDASEFNNDKLGACDPNAAPLGNSSAGPSSGVFDMVQPGPGTASPADSCGSPRIESAGPSRRAPPLNGGSSSAGNAGDGVLADERNGADGESLVQLEDGRSPDAHAEDIMSQPSNHCTKEQLELLYKTCRCACLAPRCCDSCCCLSLLYIVFCTQLACTIFIRQRCSWLVCLRSCC